MLVFKIHHSDDTFQVRRCRVVLYKYLFGNALGSFGKDREVDSTHWGDVAVYYFVDDVDLTVLHHFFGVGLENLFDWQSEELVEKE